jgi:hypothetical protein
MDGFTWDRMTKLAGTRLPAPRILHPWPDQRFAVNSQGRSGMLASGSFGSVRGCPAMGIPNRDPGSEAVICVVTGSSKFQKFCRTFGSSRRHWMIQDAHLGEQRGVIPIEVLMGHFAVLKPDDAG